MKAPEVKAVPVPVNLEQVFAALAAEKQPMLDTWQDLVNRDCGSRNKAGVDACGRRVQVFLESLGFRVRFHEYEKAGNFLVAERGDTSKPFVALLGHLDTVFPDGEAAARPFTVRDGRVTGPGVLDMKGGVTVMLYALKELIEAGWNRLPVKVLLPGDEEVGHGSSGAAEDLVREAKGALCGFNLETSYPDNSVVVERKGAAFFRLEVKGIGAHAGNNPQDGRSAIVELASKILKISALTDWGKGTTLNPGMVGGGTAANAIAEKAWCVIDVRYRTEAEFERVESALRDIASSSLVPDTHGSLTLTCRLAAMERTAGSEALFEKINAIAQRHGFPAMRAKAVGGGSDSAYLVKAGVPVVCALGVKGEFNHTVREYALESSLLERARLLAAILCEIEI